MSDSLCLVVQEPWLCTSGKPSDVATFYHHHHWLWPHYSAQHSCRSWIWPHLTFPTTLSVSQGALSPLITMHHCLPLNMLALNAYPQPCAFAHTCAVLVSIMTLFFYQPPHPPLRCLPQSHSQFNCFCPWTPIHIYISLSGHSVL